MTAQFGEGLIYHGSKVTMCTEPLGDYFAFGGERPDFATNCTALWRGYVGTWEVIDDRLYLVSLSGTLRDGTKATLATIFPDYPERAFAHWYSGTLRIPEGKQIEYVHMGYGSTFERDILLKIDKGLITGTSIQNNGAADSKNAPEGYGVAAMTVFPVGTGQGEK